MNSNCAVCHCAFGFYSNWKAVSFLWSTPGTEIPHKCWHIHPQIRRWEPDPLVSLLNCLGSYTLCIQAELGNSKWTYFEIATIHANPKKWQLFSRRHRWIPTNKFKSTMQHPLGCNVYSKHSFEPIAFIWVLHGLAWFTQPQQTSTHKQV